MKKITVLILLLSIGIFKNACFAADTLYIVFNSTDSNQYVTKNIKPIYITPFYKPDICVIEKLCWFNYSLNDSGEPSPWVFCFTHLIVTDSIKQDESNAVDNAWDVAKLYEASYRSCNRKDTLYKKRLALKIKDFKEYNKHGHILIKKDRFNFTASEVINLADIKTKDQLTALKNKIQSNAVFLIDLQQQPKRNKWLAFKVAAVHLLPVD